ncbi:hypothetical protein ABS768_13365 [Flavobacterium sp. ST-75]|uniref:Uncharacterized protein n=1 Tax=Flavobacterium rhizophilum TaxID=3163296 RepID=A0ABW8YF48_9FLAO
MNEILPNIRMTTRYCHYEEERRGNLYTSINEIDTLHYITLAVTTGLNHKKSLPKKEGFI